MSEKDEFKLEDATITGKDSTDDYSTKKDDNKSSSKSKAKKKSSSSKKKSSSSKTDEHLGSSASARKKARSVKEVTAPLSVEESGVPGEDSPTVEGGKKGSTTTAKVNKVVLDPRILREQERKDFYAENTINPSAPPASYTVPQDLRKMGRKDSYVEGEVNPSAPPSPV